MRMAIAPPAASQLTFDNVGMEVRINPATAPTATNAAVQVPCPDTALSPIEKLRMPEPATKIQSEDIRVSTALKKQKKCRLRPYTGKRPPQAILFRSDRT
jgi:hypothetical protein